MQYVIFSEPKSPLGKVFCQGIREGFKEWSIIQANTSGRRLGRGAWIEEGHQYLGLAKVAKRYIQGMYEETARLYMCVPESMGERLVSNPGRRGILHIPIPITLQALPLLTWPSSLR